MKFKISTLLAWFAVGTSIVVVLYERINLRSTIEAAVKKRDKLWNAQGDVRNTFDSIVFLDKYKYQSREDFEEFSERLLKRRFVRMFFVFQSTDQKKPLLYKDESGALSNAKSIVALLNTRSPDELELSADMKSVAEWISEHDDSDFQILENDFREFRTTVWHLAQYQKNVQTVIGENDPEKLIDYTRSAVFLFKKKLAPRFRIDGAIEAVEKLPAKYKTQKEKLLLELRSIQDQG